MASLNVGDSGAVLQGGTKILAALRHISRKVGRGGSLKVGFLEGATYPDGKSVAMVAAVQNYGAPSRNIPPRPFFSNTIAEHSSGWPAEIRAQLKATDYDVVTAMNRVGAMIQGQIRQSIRDTNSPPLKPATIRRKGFDKPLIHRGIMLNSVDFEYEER